MFDTRASNKPSFKNRRISKKNNEVEFSEENFLDDCKKRQVLIVRSTNFFPVTQQETVYDYSEQAIEK
jgi:hypothetical protein